MLHISVRRPVYLVGDKGSPYLNPLYARSKPSLEPSMIKKNSTVNMQKYIQFVYFSLVKGHGEAIHSRCLTPAHDLSISAASSSIKGL